MSMFERMGYTGPLPLVIGLVSAALAGMVGLGTYGYLRDKKRWGTWKAGAGAGAIGVGVGAGLSLLTSYIAPAATAGLSMRRISGIEMRQLRGITMQRVGLLSANKISQAPFVVAGLTAERLGLGCSGCGL